jgi:L-gulonate 3-dehydrogenase
MARIAIVGCGLVGTSWCLVFARAGHQVLMHDPSEAAVASARDFIARSLPDMVAQGLLQGRSGDQVMALLTPASDMAEAVDQADHVQESAPEIVDVKRALYRELDRMAGPATVLASSTSALPASSFTEGLAGRSRCLVAHPINPPHLIPLVELVPSPWTDRAVVDRTETLLRDAGQAPIRLKREINGFVVNRLQSAVLAEAFRLVADDACEVGDVDAAMAQGLGLRWFFMGPFETIDLNAPGGITDYCAKLGPMYHELAKEQAVVRPWDAGLVAKVESQRRALLAKESLPQRRSWRDRCLAALVAAKRQVARDWGR